MKGSYILLIKLNEDKTIKIGKKQQKIFFKKGYYAYVGSAMNGLEQRINRHLRKNKKFYWHIDYLLEYSKIEKIYYLESTKKRECEIAKKFNQKFQNISDFGCSDCKCKSHLFLVPKEKTIDIIKKLNMNSFIF